MIGGVANCQLGGAKGVYNNYIHGNYRSFKRQRLEDERTTRTTTQVLNIIEKVTRDRYSH